MTPEVARSLAHVAREGHYAEEALSQHYFGEAWRLLEVVGDFKAAEAAFEAAEAAYMKDVGEPSIDGVRFPLVLRRLRART